MLNEALIERIEEIAKSGKPGSVTIHHDEDWNEVSLHVETKEIIKAGGKCLTE